MFNRIFEALAAKGGLNFNLHAVYDDHNRLRFMLLSGVATPLRHLVDIPFSTDKPVEGSWRRILTRYDRCAHTFMSAICIAATVIFEREFMSPEP